jgi:hypothetical protein
LVKIHYRDIPGFCSCCNQKDHTVKMCPLRGAVVQQGVRQENLKSFPRLSNDFLEVRGRKGKQIQNKSSSSSASSSSGDSRLIPVRNGFSSLSIGDLMGTQKTVEGGREKGLVMVGVSRTNNDEKKEEARGCEIGEKSQKHEENAKSNTKRIQESTVEKDSSSSTNEDRTLTPDTEPEVQSKVVGTSSILAQAQTLQQTPSVLQARSADMSVTRTGAERIADNPSFRGRGGPIMRRRIPSTDNGGSGGSGTVQYLRSYNHRTPPMWRPKPDLNGQASSSHSQENSENRDPNSGRESVSTYSRLGEREVQQQTHTGELDTILLEESQTLLNNERGSISERLGTGSTDELQSAQGSGNFHPNIMPFATEETDSWNYQRAQYFNFINTRPC